MTYCLLLLIFFTPIINFVLLFFVLNHFFKKVVQTVDYTSKTAAGASGGPTDKTMETGSHFGSVSIMSAEEERKLLNGQKDIEDAMVETLKNDPFWVKKSPYL